MIPVQWTALAGAMLLLLLNAEGASSRMAQDRDATGPLPVLVLPEGRLLRVEIEGGGRLLARIASPGTMWRLGLAEGGVTEVPAETILRVATVRGTVRRGRFWPDGTEPPGLLGPAARFLRAPTPDRAPPLSLDGHGAPASTTNQRRPAFSPRPGLVLGTSLDLGPVRGAMATATLDPDGRTGSVMIEADSRLASVGRLSVLAAGRMGASGGEGDLSFLALGTLRWSPDEATQLQLSVGMPPVIEAALFHRPLRRWAALLEAAAAPGGPAGAATGVRYIGDALSVEAGIAVTALPAAMSRASAPRILPVLRVLHRR